MEDSWDFFISHAAEDIEIAKRLHAALAEQGWRPFLASAQLPQYGNASGWSSALDLALDNSASLIALVSDAALASDWVQYEWRSVHDGVLARRGGLLIPVCVSGPDPGDLPRALRYHQALDLREGSEFELVLEHILKRFRSANPDRTPSPRPDWPVLMQTHNSVFEAPWHSHAIAVEFSQLALFEHVEVSLLDWVIASATFRHLQAGEHLGPMERINALCIVLVGQIECVRDERRGGKETYWPGAFYGLEKAMADTADTGELRAVCEAIVVEIPRGTVRQLAQQSPSFGALCSMFVEARRNGFKSYRGIEK